MTVVNGRFIGLRVSGMERYAREVVCRMDTGRLRIVGPRWSMPGLRGQLWEQFLLPQRMQAGEVLWSPTNTGPVAYHPHVVTVHDVAVFDHPEWFRARVRVAYGNIVARVIRDADLITTPSEFTRGRVIAMFVLDPKRVRVVRAGMSPDWLWPASGLAEESGTSEQLGQIELTRFGLAAGGNDPRKNIERLVAAWEGVRTVEKDLDLVLLGSAAPHVFAGGISARRPWIHWIGNVTDGQMDRLYRAAEVLLYPSIYEGFGLPPLEALARGTPVVVSDIPALRESLDNFGRFVDPWDVKSIARGVMEVVGARETKDALVRRVAETLTFPTWETAARLMEEILDEAASARQQ